VRLGVFFSENPRKQPDAKESIYTTYGITHKKTNSKLPYFFKSKPEDLLHHQSI